MVFDWQNAVQPSLALLHVQLYSHLRIVEVPLRCRNENVLWLRCVNSNTNCSVPGFISINNWHVWTAIFKVNTCVHIWQVGTAFARACADSFGSSFHATFQKILNFFCCPFHLLCSWFLRLLFTVMNGTYMCRSSNHVLAAEPESTS